MRKDRYLVGYGGAGNVVYGKHHTRVSRKEVRSDQDYSAPMTIFQAKRAVKKLMSRGGKIYKLVEVDQPHKPVE